MRPTPRWLLAPALLAGLLVFVGPAAAVFPPPVRDDGKFFAAEALEKANKKVKQIYEEYGKDVVIETFAAIPADLEKKYKEVGKKEFFADWARTRATALGVHGVYVLICKSPGRIEVEVDKETRKKAFTLGDRDKLVQKIADKFREKKFDEGLQDGLEFVATALRANVSK